VTDPVEVLLKFAFLAVLYLFLFWVARSALKDLRRTPGRQDAAANGPPERIAQAPLLIAMGGGGLRAGVSFAINGALTIGRSPAVEVQIDDGFASARHARIYEREGSYYLEDSGSTNGTYLNGRRLTRRERLRADDSIRIGDTEFRYQQ
jgi:pSer/pThr/pTyr-binding forkhead associated (FHA) protein